MGKTRRGNYIFVTWSGDHSPYHVHVYKDGKLVVKWDLDNNQAMKGKMTAKISSIIKDLKREGIL